MIRDHLKEVVDFDPDFEWRGRNVTRIENLSDIVFALALGMLVSSSSPPSNFNELNSFLLNIVPVSAGFAILLIIWNAHFVYFRRYGLADGKAIFLNAILLLLVLFIAYPLRFIFDSLFGFVLAMFGSYDRITGLGLGYDGSAQIMAIYSLGYGAIFLIINRLYAHALKRKDLLGLSEKEVALTKLSVRLFWIQVILALIVAAIARFTVIGAFAGFFYFFNWPLGYLAAHVTLRSVNQNQA